MHASYQKFARFYDAMHQRRDYDKESGFVLDQIKKINPKANSLLDVGFGTGTHLQRLSKQFEVLAGVDLNKEILEVAKLKFPLATYQQASMQDFHFDQKFDSIISLYSVFNYNLTLDAAETTLMNMYKHLNTDGVLIIALYVTKNLERKISIHVGKDENLESAKINDYVYNPETKLVTSSFVLFLKENGKVDFVTENNHQLRIFEFEEMRELLQKTGFSEPKFYDGYSNRIATNKSFYPILVSQRI